MDNSSTGNQPIDNQVLWLKWAPGWLRWCLLFPVGLVVLIALLVVVIVGGAYAVIFELVAFELGWHYCAGFGSMKKWPKKRCKFCYRPASSHGKYP